MLIDADPQGNASSGLGTDRKVEFSTYDILVGDTQMQEALVKTSVKIYIYMPIKHKFGWSRSRIGIYDVKRAEIERKIGRNKR